MTWFHPAGSLRSGEADVVVTPETAPWTYCGLQVWTLTPGQRISLDLSDAEGVLVPLSARDVSVTVDGEAFTLAGRSGVFDSVSDWMYIQIGRAHV